MKIRTTQPKNNKYYIRKATGGLNGAVQGSPTIKGANVLCNCVGYANGRFSEIMIDPEIQGIYKTFKYQLVCNAENFIESAKKQGLKISSTPVEGGIMVWQKGGTLGGGDGAGHVAVVEEVYTDGSILTSESGYGAWAFKTVRRNNANGRWSQSSAYKFRGCVINPGVQDPKVVPAPPLTVDGIGGPATVSAMQRFFSTPQDGVISGQLKTQAKYYPALIAIEYGKNGSPCIRNLQRWAGSAQDGIIGQNTVKAWQRKLGATDDGIFGPNSMRAWQKYLNEHDKADYPEETKQQKAVEYGEALADDNSFHYVVYKSGDAKTKECPICRKFPNGAYKGFNCIRFVFTCWYHAGIPCKHEGGLINNAIGDKMLAVKTDAEALKLAQDAIGCKDIKVIRNKNGIPQSQLQVGDACLHYDGTTYTHIFLYAGGGKMVDCGNWKNQADQIKVRTAQSCKVLVRYIGK